MAFKTKFEETNKGFKTKFEETNKGFKTNTQSYIGNLNKDYTKLENKPSINGVSLIGDKSFGDLGIEDLTKMEILEAVQIAANEVFK